MVLQPEICVLVGKALFAGDGCDITGAVVLSVERTEVMYVVDTTNFEDSMGEAVDLEEGAGIV